MTSNPDFSPQSYHVGNEKGQLPHSGVVGRKSFRDKATGKGWTRLFRIWLKFTLAESDSSLGPNGQSTLASLIRQLDFLEEEEKRLTEQVYALAAESRYVAMVEGGLHRTTNLRFRRNPRAKIIDGQNYWSCGTGGSRLLSSPGVGAGGIG